MYTLLAFIAIFGGVVFIHELGHFLAARSVGVRVERFYVGFDFFGLGYTIYKGKETEYGIGLFPFGGYCKIAGMVDESLDESVKGSDDEFNSKNTIEKLWILSAGVIMNFILAIFLCIFIYNFYGLQEQPTVVNEVSKNLSVDPDKSISIGSKIHKINGKKVYYWSDIDKIINQNISSRIVEVEYFEKKSQRIQTINIELEKNIIPFFYPLYEQMKKNGAIRYKNDSILFMSIGLNPLPEGYLLPYINSIVPNSPASVSKLTDKSLILKMNGKIISKWSDITEFLKNWNSKINSNDCINITFENYQGIQETCIYPNNGKIGIVPSLEKVKMIPENIVFRKIDFLESLKISLIQPYEIIKMQLWGFGQLFDGKMGMDSLGGPIKITKAAGEAASYGLSYFLKFMAIISTILGFMNILPIPGLDGGHGLMTIIEGVSGRKIPTKIKIMIQQVAIVLILMLTVLILGNDIRNLF